MSLLACLGKPVSDPAIDAVWYELEDAPQISRDADLGRTYLVFSQRGVEFMVGPEGRVQTIQLFAGGAHNHVRYTGELPHDLAFTNSRAETRAKLGQPAATQQEEEQVPVLGKRNPWDVYDFPAHTLHIEFTADAQQITRVSLMRADIAPGRAEREGRA